ncbi:MAG: hypothetical protein ACJA1Z_002210 [Patiriisocius sp.]|jgi:hypothetical protein
MIIKIKLPTKKVFRISSQRWRNDQLSGLV